MPKVSNGADNIERQAVTLYRHVKELSQLKYESELRREDSLIQQSSHMQTAFAFMTAALFMAAPIIYEYRGKMPFGFLLLVFSSIVFFLIISLITASMAQRRVKVETFPSIKELEKFVDENWEQSLNESQQLKQWVELVGKVQKNKDEINARRVIFIRISMISFFISIGLVVFWFVFAVFKYMEVN